MSPRGLRGAALLAATALALLGGVAPAAADQLPRPADVRAQGTPTPAPTTGTTTPLPAQVTVTSVTPLLMTPQGTLTVTGTITNTGTESLEVVVARLRLVPSGLRTRTELDAWLQGGDLRTGTALDDAYDKPVGLIPAGGTVPIIPAGGRVPITLTVPAAALGLAGQRFGAYGLAVEVRAQGENGRERVGLLRTTLQWQPEGADYEPQQVAWLVPFTGLPVGEDGAAPTDAEVAASVAPGSRLRRLLDGASGDQVSWAVDPALLQRLATVASPAPVDGDDDDEGEDEGEGTPTGAAPETPSTTASPTTSPSTSATASPTTPAPTPAPTDQPDQSTDEAGRQVAADFLAAMRSAAARRTIIELPYGDPDLAAITSTRRTDLVDAAQATGLGIIREVLGVTPAVNVGWPAQGWATDAQLEVLRAADVRDVVLDERSRRLVDTLPYTPDARVDLAQGLTGWLSDPALSALVAGARGPDIRRVQQALAQTAAATSERPSLSRRLLVTAPRDADVDPVALSTLIAATSTAPWVRVVPVTDLRRAAGGEDGLDTADLPRRSTPPPAAVEDAQLGAAHVAAVRRLRGRLAALGEVVTSPTGLTNDLQRSSLELLSTSWRGRPEQLRERRAVVADTVSTLNDQLQVLPSSVNLLASSGRLQITIVDGLSQDVSGARLRVTSTNPRLLVREQEVEVPDLASGTRTQVLVPVQAIASGVVQLKAQLIAPSGSEIGREVTVTVRAQPTGSWALWVLGGVAAVVMVVGLVRALRRPRRQEALTEPPTAMVTSDEHASGPTSGDPQ